MKEYQVQIKSDHSKVLTLTAASPQKERGMER